MTVSSKDMGFIELLSLIYKFSLVHRVNCD
jgi:hypothetical protein